MQWEKQSLAGLEEDLPSLMDHAHRTKSVRAHTNFPDHLCTIHPIFSKPDHACVCVCVCVSPPGGRVLQTCQRVAG